MPPRPTANRCFAKSRIRTAPLGPSCIGSLRLDWLKREEASVVSIVVHESESETKEDDLATSLNLRQHQEIPFGSQVVSLQDDTSS